MIYLSLYNIYHDIWYNISDCVMHYDVKSGLLPVTVCHLFCFLKFFCYWQREVAYGCKHRFVQLHEAPKSSKGTVYWRKSSRCPILKKTAAGLSSLQMLRSQKKNAEWCSGSAGSVGFCRYSVYINVIMYARYFHLLYFLHVSSYSSCQNIVES